MEPVGWVIDTENSVEQFAEVDRIEANGGSQFSASGSGAVVGATKRVCDLLNKSTSIINSNSGDTSTAVHVQAGRSDGGASRQPCAADNPVDALLRRIAREGNRGDSKRDRGPSRTRRTRWRREEERDGHSRHGHPDDSTMNTNSTSTKLLVGGNNSSGAYPLPHHTDVARSERHGVAENDGRMTPRRQRDTAGYEDYNNSRSSALPLEGQGQEGRSGRGVATTDSAAAISVAEADPFTEKMWESAPCREVLQAMFFAPGSAVPAGSTEEYKEVEDFIPKYLARRAKARAAGLEKLSGSSHGASTATEQSASTYEVHQGTRSIVTTPAPAPAPPAPPALSALPASFHKRYLVNFTVLSPQQQQAAQQAEREKKRAEVEGSGHRRWRGGGARGAWDATSTGDRSKAAFRELARRGVLEREDVNAMLRPGPLQDFRGSVLQAFLDFRMRRSLTKVLKLRRDRAALPIAAFQGAIVHAIASNPCVLVAGDTGCGKSTQVPQFLLQAGYGKVACTQPRRISAMGLCRRVSYETLNEHGAEVAYQVRFDSSRRRSSRILFLTEGLLLRQIARDPDLSAYSVVIVDEVHERHAGCDFLLGLLRAVLRRRSDLKVVLMSATINPELFSRFFDGAPLIRVPGRLHPVEVRYVPTAADNDIQEVVSRHDGEGQRKLRSRSGGGRKRVVFDARPYVKLLETIDTSTPRDERGDLLVFLSGMGDMLAVTEGVREYVEAKSPRRWVVLMLHSSLSVEEQDKVFDAAPLGTRKMILATNIAETSVTIDGVRFVADSGKAKEMSWDPKSGVRSLQEFWVSRASAEQRKGRAGRTGPGLCFRLYGRGTFDRLAPFAEPEIRRCPLEGLVLQMKSLGLDDPRLFPYLSPPPPENLGAALEALALLGATDAAVSASVSMVESAPFVAQADTSEGSSGKMAGSLHETPSVSRVELAPPEGGVALSPTSVFENATARAPLTPLGRVLSVLPVDPSVGKMLALGALLGESEHVLTLAAALSTQTPFDARAAASASGTNPVAEFASPDGDPFTVMNAYDEWVRVKAARQESSRRWCKRHGLQEQRLYEITKLRRQFEDLLRDAGLIWLGAAAKRARQSRSGNGRRGAPASGGAHGGASKAKIRDLKMRREGRKRKVLEVDHGDVGSGEAVGEEGSGGMDEAEEARKDLRGEVGQGDGDDAGLDLSSLEFYMAQDVDQLAESSGRRLARRDVVILKAILCQGLYPHFAVADAGNAGRASNEQQYVTRPSGGLFMSPSSVLACQDFGVIGASDGGGGWRGSTMRGGSGVASRGAAADAGRGDGLLCYGQLMETQRPFVSSVTPLPALQALLLFSARVDTSEDASLVLFDHWLLVEMRGRDPALTGQKLLVVACGLRARLGALLSGALAEAEKRRGIGAFSGGMHEQEQNLSTIKGMRNAEDDGGRGGLQDFPPLIMMARRAWLEGGDIGRGSGTGEVGGGRGGGRSRAGDGEERAVDWAQEAEDLSVELADFMLQSIGYDVKSVPPRQVEALLVDPLRLRDPTEVRRILRGHPDLPDDEGPDETAPPTGAEGDGEGDENDTDAREPRKTRRGNAMPELLSLLSRAVEEEIRGSKGLFGLETGVLERLKGGGRVTSFLRHGSVRRHDSAGAAPHGLAAGGMKKWWRCPRCHISQVVDLEAIHEHFKVCLVDPAPDGASKGSRSNDRPRRGQEEEVIKKPRMVGTSVKSGRARGGRAREKNNA